MFLGDNVCLFWHLKHPEGRSWNSLHAGCDIYRVILPVHFLKNGACVLKSSKGVS